MNFDPQAPSYFVNPLYRPASGPMHQVIDPATLESVGMFADSQAADIESALDAVTRAQQAWRRCDAKSRAKALHALANAIETADLRRCAELMTREMGKPYPEAIGELANCAPVFRYYAEMARDEAGKVAGTTEPGSFQYSRYEPLGVSVHIVPFNFPILISCWTLAASLAAGNHPERPDSRPRRQAMGPCTPRPAPGPSAPPASTGEEGQSAPATLGAVGKVGSRRQIPSNGRS